MRIMWDMKGKKSPCLNCEKRHEGCHSNCDGYKDYQAQLRAERVDLHRWMSETYMDRWSPTGKKGKKK